MPNRLSCKREWGVSRLNHTKKNLVVRRGGKKTEVKTSLKAGGRKGGKGGEAISKKRKGRRKIEQRRKRKKGKM